MRKLLILFSCLISITSASAGDDIPDPDNGGSNPSNQDPAAISGRLWVERVSGRFVGDTGTFTFQVNISIENIDPPYGTKWSGFTNAFRLHSPGGVSWSNFAGAVSPALSEGWGGDIVTTTWADGISSDTVGFKTTGQPKKFLGAGQYDSAFTVSVLLSRSDRGKTICLDSISVPPLYQWSWETSSVGQFRPRWGGEYCFTIESPFVISATAGENGSISPAGNVEAAPGSDQTFDISANTGYHISDVIVDGAGIGPVASYTFTNVTTDHTIHAEFAVDTFTIVSTAGQGGSISPDGTVPVIYGGSQTFSITPNDGYHITQVLVDGNPVGAISQYEFTSVSQNHTISASFAVNNYSIEATAGPNGAIAPSGTVWVAHGDNQSFTITPNAGYHVSDVFVDGSSIGAVTGHTFTNVTSNHSIAATFVIDTLTVIATASANGTISPSGTLTAIYGSDLTFNMAPTGQGYLVDVFVDGNSVGPQSSYTFSQISANHTIFALFNDSTFLPTQQYSADIMFLQTTDLDQDNFTDIVYSSSGVAPDDIAGLWVAYGKLGGTFDPPVRLLKARRTPIAFGFINADTAIDIVTVGGVDGQQVYRIFNYLDRTYSVDSQAYSGAIANSIVSGYFNDDSYVDFLLGNGTLLLGGMNASAAEMQTTINAISLNTGDFNNDGITDLAAGDGDSIRILLSDGSGNFVQSASYFAGHNLSPIPPTRSVADLDNDNNPDVASVVLIQETPEAESYVTVAFGDGLGGVRSVFSQEIDGYAVNAQIADVDRDHYLDIVSSCGSNPEQRVIVLYGDGAGNFPRMSETSYPTAPGTTLAIGTGDLDRDGNPDFVSGGYQGPAPITIMYSTPPDANVLVDEMVVTVFSGVSSAGNRNNRARAGSPEVTLSVTNPDDYEISQNSTTVSGSFYWQLDADNNLIVDNRTIDYNLAEGEYEIVVYEQPGADNPTYAVVVGIDGSQQATVELELGGGEGNIASANSVDSQIYYFRIEAIPAIEPQSGEPTANSQPIISWPHLLPPGTPTTTYDFQLSDYTDFRTLIDEATGLPTTEYMVAQKLAANNVYFWRVREVDAARSGQSVGEWSHHYSLYIVPGCCSGFTGNVDCDPDDLVDIADLAALIDHLFISLQPLCCGDEANVDGIDGVDLTDLASLIANIYLDPEYFKVVNCPQ
jgi:hypothetical protein